MATAAPDLAGQWLRAGARGLLDLVLPPRCPACREIVADEHRFCAACWAQLAFITAPFCAGCGVPFEVDAGADARCGECLLRPRRFDAARAAVVYAGPGRAAVLGLKHGDRLHLSEVMAPHLHRTALDWLGPDTLLVPVPLHRWRLWRRGFNQSVLLAASLARRSGAPLERDALVRVRATRTSQGLNRRQRALNVRAAFKVVRPAAVAGRNIVLVDDVYTTGATVEACTRVLRRAGALSVRVLTWARVVRGGASHIVSTESTEPEGMEVADGAS